MFIVLEGVDGCGKSTHAKLLANWLREKGRDVLLTAEPTDGPVGRLIREVLAGKLVVDPRTLALLFTADRAEHVGEMRKALSEGKTVVCDRYFYSTVAYQCAQGVERRWLLGINGFAPKPKVVVLLDVDPALGEVRTRTGEIFERQEFLRKVRRQYLKFKGLKVVDSSRPAEEVQEEIRSIVGRRL